MIIHTYFFFAGIGLQVPDLKLAIFAYFDQYLVSFFYGKFIKNIGYYEEGG